jgi:acetyl esterase
MTLAPSADARAAAIEAKYAMLTDPGIRRFMVETELFYPADAVNFTIAEQRAFYDRLCLHFRKPRPPGLAVSDAEIVGPGGPIRVRLYRPPAENDLPVLLYLHGGGYILGGLDSHDDICAEIARGAGIAVVALDYRLAPEHLFPAAFEDAGAALDWLIAGGAGNGFDLTRLIVGGDSAGGNLSAALALKLRDEDRPVIRGLVLIYPGLGGDLSRGSYVEHAKAPGLATADVRYYKTVYVGPEVHPNHSSKFAYPLKETDYRGLPPAFLIACEWDPLRDDCFDWRDRVVAAGGEAKVRHEPLLVHAFLRARHMSTPARASFAAIVAEARALAFTGRLARDSTS